MRFVDLSPRSTAVHSMSSSGESCEKKQKRKKERRGTGREKKGSVEEKQKTRSGENTSSEREGKHESKHKEKPREREKDHKDKDRDKEEKRDRDKEKEEGKGKEKEQSGDSKDHDQRNGERRPLSVQNRGRSNSDLGGAPGEYVELERKDSQNLFGRFPRIFKKSQTIEARMKKEEIEYSKEMKKRIRYQAQNEKKESMLRPVHDSETFSDKFITTSNEEVRVKKNYAFYVECLEDLPPDIHESLERMRIPANVLENNFELLLNILSFADKHIPRRRFLLFNNLFLLLLLLSLSPK